MRLILIAVGISLAVSILLTPALIRMFTRQGFGQEIREDGPPSHKTKRGTPSMGGVAILAGIWAGYFGAHLVGLVLDGDGPSASGLLVLGLATALGGVGFLDDMIKIRQSRNLGLNKTAKALGQITAALLFGVLVLQFANADGLTPGSPSCPMYARSPPWRCRRRCSCCSSSSWSAHGRTPSTSPMDSTAWRPDVWPWSAPRTC
jgi:phospho-N-acetylmuramoyl-pentapeptide-transferase